MTKALKRLFKRTKVFVAICTVMIAACVFLGTTYSWFTSKDKVVNTLPLGLHSVEIVEIFETPDIWIPGETAVKEVSFANWKETDALLRIKYDEYWVRAEDGAILSNQFTYETTEEVIDEESGEVIEVTTRETVDAAEKNWTEFWVNGSNEEWVDGGDGYYYYCKVLRGADRDNNITNTILESVNFHPGAIFDDRGISYSSAEYTLTFTTESLLAGGEKESIQDKTARVKSNFKNVSKVTIVGDQVIWEFEMQ